MEDQVTITVQVPMKVAKLIAAEAIIKDIKYDFYLEDTDKFLREHIGIWWNTAELLQINGKEW